MICLSLSISICFFSVDLSLFFPAGSVPSFNCAFSRSRSSRASFRLTALFFGKYCPIVIFLSFPSTGDLNRYIHVFVPLRLVTVPSDKVLIVSGLITSINPSPSKSVYSFSLGLLASISETVSCVTILAMVSLCK